MLSQVGRDLLHWLYFPLIPSTDPSGGACDVQLCRLMVGVGEATLGLAALSLLSDWAFYLLGFRGSSSPPTLTARDARAVNSSWVCSMAPQSTSSTFGPVRTAGKAAALASAKTPRISLKAVPPRPACAATPFTVTFLGVLVAM
jgi:hypothetical protein